MKLHWHKHLNGSKGTNLRFFLCKKCHFSYFLNKVIASQTLVMDLDVFFEKNKFFRFFWTKKPRKCAHSEVFQVLWKINALNFLIFCLKLEEHKVLKLSENTFFFFFENSCFKAFSSKGTKVSFVKLYEKVILRIFFMFWIKLSENRSFS